MINGVIHNMQGQQLPANWQSEARARAMAAEADYLARLQAAWLTPKAATMVEIRPIRSCRLGQF